MAMSYYSHPSYWATHNYSSQTTACHDGSGLDSLRCYCYALSLNYFVMLNLLTTKITKKKSSKNLSERDLLADEP